MRSFSSRFGLNVLGLGRVTEEEASCDRTAAAAAAFSGLSLEDEAVGGEMGMISWDEEGVSGVGILRLYGDGSTGCRRVHAPVDWTAGIQARPGDLDVSIGGQSWTSIRAAGAI